MAVTGPLPRPEPDMKFSIRSRPETCGAGEGRRSIGLPLRPVRAHPSRSARSGREDSAPRPCRRSPRRFLCSGVPEEFRHPDTEEADALIFPKFFCPRGAGEDSSARTGEAAGRCLTRNIAASITLSMVCGHFSGRFPFWEQDLFVLVQHLNQGQESGMHRSADDCTSVPPSVPMGSVRANRAALVGGIGGM